MTPAHFAGVALASLGYVAGRAFMQLTVVHSLYRVVPACSAFIAVTEVAVIGNIAVQATKGTSLDLALTIAAMTLGGTLGAWTSMRLHAWMRGRKRT